METRDAPIRLRKVQRLDCIALDAGDKTYFTSEGYLVDHPILTSCGIFEYHEKDGSVRRELRLPEHVFAPESLRTYKGKPVIVTHDAGAIDKDNVSEEIIGTILSEGYQDGEDVRAEIIIHDTDTMKKCGLKELSLGYSLDLIEQPGEWNGEKYDAIQTNIVINHLALVSSARAGDQARLNIDGSDEPTLKGGKVMKNYHKDSDLSPEEMEKAIALYKATQPLFGGATSNDGDDEEQNAPVLNEENAEQTDEDKPDEQPTEAPKAEAPKAPMAAPKAAPTAPKAAPAAPTAKPDGGADLNAQVIAVLEKTIADLKAASGQGQPMATQDDDEEVQTPEGESEQLESEDDDEEEQVSIEEQTDEDDLTQSQSKSNCDSADKIISQKLNICRMGDKLNLDGLENMSVKAGKTAIINKVFPDMRLDGKSRAYVDCAYDLAVNEINKKHSSEYQMTQLFNARRADAGESATMAESARQRMLDREGGNN